jgi:hypothetical protein
MRSIRPTQSAKLERLMTDKPIRVGFIGLNPGIHWAATAHIPALKALPDDFLVVGVANTSLASAQNAAEAFGLPHAFENAHALVNSPEVDLVVVTVKVPHHRELVTAALLRQCPDGKLLPHAQGRTRSPTAMVNSRRGSPRPLCLYRRLL